MSQELLHRVSEAQTDVESPSKIVMASFAVFFCTIGAIVLGELVGLLFR